MKITAPISPRQRAAAVLGTAGVLRRPEPPPRVVPVLNQQPPVVDPLLTATTLTELDFVTLDNIRLRREAAIREHIAVMQQFDASVAGLLVKYQGPDEIVALDQDGKTLHRRPK